VSNAPSKPVSFSRPKVGYFSNRPRTVVHLFSVYSPCYMNVISPVIYILYFTSADPSG